MQMNKNDAYFVQSQVTDVEQIPDVLPDVHSRILQYSRGQLHARNCCLVLPGLSVHRNTANQGLLIELSPDIDSFSIVILEQATSAVNWMGQEAEAESLVIFPPGKTAQYSLPISWSSIEFFIEKPLLEKLGLISGHDGSLSYNSICQLRVSGEIYRTLLFKGKKLIAMAEEQHPALDDPVTRLDLRDSLVELLQAALQPSDTYMPESLGASIRHKLILRAQVLIEETVDSGNPLSIPDLAHQLDIHERVLYKVFKKSLGISPYAWSHLVRMHQFRQRALKSSANYGAITQIALEVGFNHLSHFSEQFKRQYGETPRQFLRRCNSRSQ